MVAKTSILRIARVLLPAGALILAGYGAAFLAGASIAFAAAGGGGSGGAGAGSGKGAGGTGTGGTGSGTGIGGTGIGAGLGAGIGGTGIGGIGSGIGIGIGAGAGIGGTGTGSGASGGSGGTSAGSGAGTGTASGGTGSSTGTGIGSGASASGTGAGIGSAASSPGTGFAVDQATPVLALPAPPGLSTPRLAPIESVAPPAIARTADTPALPREKQAFRFDVGTVVFPTTGGVSTTEEADGVDLVTVDARHHRVIHPAAFFEPRDGARYDRRAIERFWPIELGKRVRFVETLGSQHWEHVMTAARTETISVPAGVFHAFVVERTVRVLGDATRPVTTYTYWYAPKAGAIVKIEVRTGDGGPAVTEEADVLGYPIAQPGSAQSQTLRIGPTSRVSEKVQP